MQYAVGTVNVTNGSPNVVGVGTVWLANAAPGDLFTIRKTGVVYEIGSVSTDTGLVLTAPFGGVNGTALEYTISRSFTPIWKIPFPEPRDIEVVAIIKRAITLIETLFSQFFSPTVATRATNVTLTKTDEGSVQLLYTGATAITLPLLSTLKEGWSITIGNRLPSGNITVNRSGSDLIEAATTLAIANAASRTFIKQGTKWVYV